MEERGVEGELCILYKIIDFKLILNLAEFWLFRGICLKLPVYEITGTTT